jgi:DNA-binding SARP family transcriptional activator/ATP/maltotriose-dependent transcriptional regulator MalT
MANLPAHHVARPRLTDGVADHRVVVVEAAGGYGKTVLAAELVAGLQAIEVEVPLEEGPIPAQLLVSRLIAGVRRAGLHDAAEAMAAAGEDVVGSLDAGADALSRDRCVVVIDDAHHANRQAAGLIVRLASRLAGQARLVVLARHLPAGAEKLRRADALYLDASDLAIRPDEVAAVCNQGFGLSVDPEEAAAIEQATDGWTAAAVLAAARARRTGERLGQVAATTRGRDVESSGSLAAILDECLNALADQRSTLAQIGRLPLLDPTVVDAAADEPGWFDRALEAGIPFVAAADGWWVLPGPVRDLLAAGAPPDAAALERAALAYQARGRLSMALDILLGGNQHAAAARLLAGLPPAEIESLDILELLAVLDRLPETVVQACPGVLLQVAVGCDAATMFEKRRELLDRFTELVGVHASPAMQRRVDADVAHGRLNIGEWEPAAAIARRVIAEAAPDEVLTRAKAYHALGRVLYYQVNDDGSFDDDATEQAGDCFDRAANLFSELGMRSAAVSPRMYRAMWVDFARGDCERALRGIDDTAALVADRPRRWAYVLTFRAEVLLELGRFDECIEDTNEMLRMAERFGDLHLRASAHWRLAGVASCRDDPEETMREVLETEAARGEWWKHAGDQFLADAADYLDRAGHIGAALEYLRRAQLEAKDAGTQIVMSEAALAARHGDPVEAERLLVALPNQRIDPREYWRATLLRAYAALRRGDRRAGALAARAFEEAARLGMPQVPIIRERRITEELLGLAVETGEPAAVALETSALPVLVAVLGRFELTRGGRPVPLGPGQAAQLLKLIAVRAGRVHADEAIETLWPETEPEAGRNRLRTVLNRLRTSAGAIVERQGDHLVLAPDARVDLALFGADARRALALGSAEPMRATALARSALARYRGDVLPDDLYEQWAEDARYDARRTAVDLLDLSAQAAAEIGDLDGVRAAVERTITLAPYDEGRYLGVVSVLMDQGRPGAALSVLRLARRTLAVLGVPPSAQLTQLESSIVGALPLLTSSAEDRRTA